MGLFLNTLAAGLSIPGVLHSLLDPLLVKAEHFQVFLNFFIRHPSDLLMGHGDAAFLGKLDELDEGELVEDFVGQQGGEVVFVVFVHLGLRVKVGSAFGWGLSKGKGLKEQMALAKRIQIIGAHPDDCEYACGGTAALWREAGSEVQYVSLTDGCSGHHEQCGEKLVQRREKEAMRGAGLIGASCEVLDIHDGHLEANLENRLKVIKVIRDFRPDLVLTNRPNDYHADHRYTSQLVQDASFLLRVPNVVPEAQAMERMPVIAYFWDAFKKPSPFHADCAVDVDRVFELKCRQMCCHESQFMEWLPWLDGRLDEVPPQGMEHGRLKWMKEYFGSHHRPSIADVEREALVKRYGKERGGAVEMAEAFELCEYGEQPPDGDLGRLFPMD